MSTPQSGVLRINKLHWPVTTLGPGRRAGLWMQGCSIQCKDCVSKDTWSADAGVDITVVELLQWLIDLDARESLDGLTISGGEPFEQPDALLAFLQVVSEWRQKLPHSFDVLCYSGLPRRQLETEHSALLQHIDLLCPEPYVPAAGQSDAWRGSNNQHWVPLTIRGNQMINEMPPATAPRKMQVAVQDGRVWFIGIPGLDDMVRLEQIARARGLVMQQPSWLA